MQRQPSAKLEIFSKMKPQSFSQFKMYCGPLCFSLRIELLANYCLLFLTVRKRVAYEVISSLNASHALDKLCPRSENRGEKLKFFRKNWINSLPVV